MEALYCDVVGCASMADWICLAKLSGIPDDYLCHYHHDALRLSDHKEESCYVPLSSKEPGGLVWTEDLVISINGLPANPTNTPA